MYYIQPSDLIQVLPIVLTMSFVAKRPHSELWVAFGCHFCLFLSETVPLPTLDFCDLCTFEGYRQLLWVMSLPVGFPCDEIQIIHPWQEHHRNGAVLYPLLWAAILVCPITDYFTLIPGLRWHLPGFFTVKTFPPLVINNYLWGATMFLLVCTKLSIYSLLISVWNRDFLFDSKR